MPAAPVSEPVRIGDRVQVDVLVYAAFDGDVLGEDFNFLEWMNANVLNKATLQKEINARLVEEGVDGRLRVGTARLDRARILEVKGNVAFYEFTVRVKATAVQNGILLTLGLVASAIAAGIVIGFKVRGATVQNFAVQTAKTIGRGGGAAVAGFFDELLENPFLLAVAVGGAGLVAFVVLRR